MRSIQRFTPNACFARTPGNHERPGVADLSGRRDVTAGVRPSQAYVDTSHPCACRVIVASRGHEPYVTLSPRVYPKREQ